MSKIIKSKEVRYQLDPVIYGKYKQRRIAPREGTASIAVDASGGQTLTYEIPDIHFNAGIEGSYIKIAYTTSAASGAGAYQYMPADCIPFFRTASYQPREGYYLIQIEELANYTKLALRPDTKYSELETSDPINLFRPSNVVASQNKRADGGNAYVHYMEPQFFNVSGNNAQLSGTLYLPLKYILPNTILSMDKDWRFNQITTLQFVFHPTTKFLFTATDQYNPASGQATIANNITFNITSAYLYLMEERDEAIKISIDQEIAKGMEVSIPWVKKAYKANFAAQTSQAVQVKLYRSDGYKLLDIYHGIWQSPETVNNVQANYSLPGTFYTTLDSVKEQDFDYSIGLDDYMKMKEQLIGSSVLSAGAFQNSWFWRDSYRRQMPKDEQGIDENLSLMNQLQGEDLDRERIWEFNATFNANQTTNHYSFAVTLKKIRITPMGVEVF